MQVIGKIEEVMPLEQKTQTFQVRKFILEIAQANSQYTEHVQFQTTNARTIILDQMQLGQEVIVDFDLRGRKWTSPDGKVNFFNSLEAWKITPYASQHPATTQPAPATAQFQQPAMQQPTMQNASGFAVRQPGAWQQQATPAQPAPKAGAMGNSEEIPF